MHSSCTFAPCPRKDGFTLAVTTQLLPSTARDIDALTAGVGFVTISDPAPTHRPELVTMQAMIRVTTVLDRMASSPLGSARCRDVQHAESVVLGSRNCQ